MKPYIQGDLGGLCGVYSVINATRIVAGLDRDESEKLFSSIMDYIGDARLVADGIGIRMIGRLLRDVVGGQIPYRSMPFRTDHTATLNEVWHSLNYFLQDHHRAAIIWLGWSGSEGREGHWTTVCGAKPRQLFLVDSAHYHVLNKGTCTVGSSSKKHPHVLYPPCIYLCSDSPIRALSRCLNTAAIPGSRHFPPYLHS